MGLKLKVTYDADKLAKRLKKGIARNLHKDLAHAVKKDTIEGLESGKNIYGSRFESLKDSTKEVRNLRGHKGSKPLIGSGAMLSSIKVIKKKTKSFVSAKAYGSGNKPNAHNEGFITQNIPKIKGKSFYFRGSKIPARPWFHNEYSIALSKGIQGDFLEAAMDYFKEFNRAFTK